MTEWHAHCHGANQDGWLEQSRTCPTKNKRKEGKENKRKKRRDQNKKKIKKKNKRKVNSIIRWKIQEKIQDKQRKTQGR